ncbi:DUF4232 domain-containing protein [Solirubrobacter soli]|uniref:DUF4232 domain-containing protein n=1 Tax=Solirubrobacter soli TaxID=363832 RepID=UPI00069EE3C1|nr:DUF4232 domain-containing protein [Solirubrobacter soli]
MRTKLILPAAVCAIGAMAAAWSSGARGAAVQRCTARGLAGAIIDVQGAAGSSYARIVLVNTSNGPCFLKGFVGGRLYTADNHALTTTVRRDHTHKARRVNLRPGAAAALQLRWSNVPSDNTPCPTAEWLRITPPDDTKTLRVYFGTAACRGDLEVRPVVDARNV